MAGQWYENSPGLRQVFPALVEAAAQNQTTAQVWQTLRDAASNAASGSLSIQLGRQPTDQEVADTAAGILRGVTVQDVSRARGAAGQMASAHAALISHDPTAQITGDMIAVPPWSKTADAAGVRTQYRIRVNRSITVRGFTQITKEEWAAYNLSGPITTVADALAQANAMFVGADYNRATSINDILDYTIETV